MRIGAARPSTSTRQMECQARRTTTTPPAGESTASSISSAAKRSTSTRPFGPSRGGSEPASTVSRAVIEAARDDRFDRRVHVWRVAPRVDERRVADRPFTS
jgi:hypothetical protein